MSRKRRDNKQDQFDRARMELSVICVNYCNQKNLKLPNMNWLLNNGDGTCSEFYDKWCVEMRKEYGDTFPVIENMLLCPTKENYYYAGLDMQVNALAMLCYEYILEDMLENYGDYEEELVSAAMTPKRKHIITLSKYRATNQYTAFVLNGEDCWYPSYYPASIQNYLFHLKEAQGQPVTRPALHTILSKAICRNAKNRVSMVKFILLVFMNTVTQLCEITRKKTDQEIQSVISPDQNGSIIDIAPFVKSNIIDAMKLSSKRNCAYAIAKYTKRMAPEIYDDYAKKVSEFTSRREFLILTAAAESFGLSKMCFFHYILLRVMDSILYSDFTILSGHHDYSYKQINDVGKQEYNEAQLVLNGYTGSKLGVRMNGEVEHIMDRTLFTASTINDMVQNSIAVRYEGIAKQQKQITFEREQLEKDRDKIGKRKKQAEQEVLATASENKQLSARIAELEAALKDRDTCIAEMEKELEAYDNLTSPEDTAPENTAFDTSVFPVKVQKGFRVMVYGGHPTWVTPMSERFPNITFRAGRSAYEHDAIRTQNIILVQNNALSHGAFAPVLAEARRYGIPTVYFEKAGVDSCSKQLYDLLIANDAVDQKTVDQKT